MLELPELCSTEHLRQALLVISDCWESPWVDLLCAPNLRDHLSTQTPLICSDATELFPHPVLLHFLTSHTRIDGIQGQQGHQLELQSVFSTTEEQEESTFFLAFSSLACAFICWISMESTFLLLINKSWFPMHSWKIWRGKAKQM